MNKSKLAKEFSKVINCRLCERLCDHKLLLDEEFNLPQPGYVGEDYIKSKVLLIGQNPGVSTSSQTNNDLIYSKALARLKNPSEKAMNELQLILNKIIPSWPVTGNYFPLEECNLKLNDIAYFNLVRCRTKDNATPSKKMTQMCTVQHFEHWLDFLKPKVVVCIGKWAHDQISDILDHRGIAHDFVNRWRSLSTASRIENKQQVVAVVKNQPLPKISSTLKAKTEKPLISKKVNMNRTQENNSSTMNYEAYVEMFTKLKFRNIVTGNTLKHFKAVPSIYFNYRKRDSFASFVVYKDDMDLFPPSLWEEIPAQKGKDAKEELRTIIPRKGKEEKAFQSLIEKC